MSTINLVSTLMNHGKSLAKQLDIAKTMFQQNSSKPNIKPKPVGNNIYDEVEKVINGLMKDLDVLDDDEYTTKDCFDKVARKTISSLEELKKLDNPCYATRYKALITMVGKFRLSTDVISTHGTTTSTPAHITNDNDNDNDNDNADIYFNLGLFKELHVRRRFLLYLFAMLPRGTNIKKNDLALWYLSLNYRLHPVAKEDDGRESDFEKHVRVLVDMKLIKPVVTFAESVSKNNKKDVRVYKIHNVIWSKLQASDESDEFDTIRILKINSLYLSSVGPIRGKSVVNRDACNLTIERLIMLYNHYWTMMQLGTWNRDPRKYIVVEDVDFLIKVLNDCKMKYLSLQGVSGLVILPSLDCKLLRVFILKGYHNLESIPQFNTMPDIEYLDMSECYQLDHSANVFDDCIELRVVKGFVLPLQRDDPRNSFISNPSQFEYLWKLTLRSRRLNFPTNIDLETLCKLQSLTHLKITWIGACSPDNNQEVRFDIASKFPPKLTKFEMEAASDDTSTKILDLIAQKKKTTTIPIPLKKLYIKGGNLSKLNPEVDCKILRLHYMPKMKFDCYDMMKLFPELHRLEMSKDVMYSMLWRSFQKATGTNDQNSAWEPALTPPTSPSFAS